FRRRAPTRIRVLHVEERDPGAEAARELRAQEDVQLARLSRRRAEQHAAGLARLALCDEHGYRTLHRDLAAFHPLVGFPFSAAPSWQGAAAYAEGAVSPTSRSSRHGRRGSRW